jgi:sphinganine-1-phosphate aldolase
VSEPYPYAARFGVNRTFPEHGRPREEVVTELQAMANEEDAFWETGMCSGTIYCGDHEHYAYLNQAFGLFAHMNALQRDMCPSQTRFEGEIIAMALDLLHAGEISDGEPAGLVTGGGTSSICHAVLAYRDHARAVRGVTRPNLIKPETAHPAFDKACRLFGVELRRAPVDPETTLVRLDWVADNVDDETVALVGSACNYGYGTVDPIAELGALASERGIGLHVDGCLGGFILPFGERLGLDLPRFDFRLPGVTSISADTHKYGFGPKGTSVLLYRTRELRHLQYFKFGEWPGGLYASPGVAGSRSGGLIAATWAAMVTLGEHGYLEVARRIFDTAAGIRAAVESIPELQVIGEPTFLVAFKSDELDIYHVNDALKERGWRMNGLQLPPALHFCVTLPNTQPGVVDRFAEDLRAAVEYAKDPPSDPPRSGALYAGGAGHGQIDATLEGALDAMYELAPPD